jgi:LuxR family transcriptional regulator, quorum-sensing system regulator CciR
LGTIFVWNFLSDIGRLLVHIVRLRCTECASYAIVAVSAWSADWDPGYFELAREFAARAPLTTSPAELCGVLDDCTQALGFQCFALIDHVDLSRGGTGTIHLDTYPAAWSERFIRSRLFLEDPVLQASLRTHMGFAWDDLDRLIPVNQCHRFIFEMAQKGGIGNGFTVPANVPGDIHGSCSFATRTGCHFPNRAVGAAHLVGAFAYQAARRLHPPTPSRYTDLPKLTSRQRECVVLAGRGKSDWVIGQLLGLKTDTVTKYLVAARDRYEVATRMQIVTAALYYGEISFLEIQG